VEPAITIDPVGDTLSCGPDCPSFLRRWTNWWARQTEAPVALLDTADYDEGVGQKTRNMIRKAHRLYSFAEFDYNDRLDDMHAINTSRAERQGKPMTSRYRQFPDPIRRPWDTCSRHRSSWWGGFDANGEMRGYCNLVVLNEVGIVNTVLGHADAPAVVNGLFAHMARHADVEWIHYLTLRNSGSSLAAFKRRVGFVEYLVAAAAPVEATA
jgi:hypothetical protein